LGGAGPSKADRGNRSAELRQKVYLSFLLQGTQPSSNPVLGFLPILLIFGIFYFLLFLPMQRQKKQQKQMLANLEPGKTVLTSGGIIGTVTTINQDDTLIIRVKPDNLKIQIARSAVSGVVSDEKK
jgi:preprotein translocase subunit YajC